MQTDESLRTPDGRSLLIFPPGKFDARLEGEVLVLERVEVKKEKDS